MSDEGARGTCPVLHTATAIGNRSNHDWWPNRLNLRVLRRHAARPDPMDEGFDYRTALEALDVEQLRRDVADVMTTSQDWWPADYGHYGPLFVRMAWHSAGTYRTADGRGGGSRGAQRFAPVNSWPDNANLDKARRLLWPVKQKYGRTVSWADLIIFAGNCALESMGLETFGFAFGREDIWEPEDDVYWGPERTWLGDQRTGGDGGLADPFGAVQMGLIYVNPEGPGGNPDPLAAARDIRETFARMAMDDEETVALVAGGHTFGKTHGAVPEPGRHIGPEPEGAGVEEQGLGWRSDYGTGNAAHTWTSGLEGAWTADPVRWDNGFLDNLFGHEWELTTSPAGAKQWIPKDQAAGTGVPDAHDPSKRHTPVMLTTDLALRMDPSYAPIAQRFHEHPDQFAETFRRAWFKLTHRDLGPATRYAGPLTPAEPLLWQDPVPQVDHPLIDRVDAAALKHRVLASGLPVRQLVKAAWASAATFRGTDRRGGANGGRLRLLPQREWAVNDPDELAEVLGVVGGIGEEFNGARSSGTRVSLADLVILGGCAAVEHAARQAGHDVTVPFRPGRTDASPEQTDVEAFAVLEPMFDGFRNYLHASQELPPEHLLVERADLLGLTVQEMTVLVGGLRSLDANAGHAPHGVLTDRPGVLSNDFFVNLLDMRTLWAPSASSTGVFEGRDRSTGEVRWTCTAVDLVFGSNAELRAVAEIYGSDNSESRFVKDFVAAWDKVMNLDRFDLA